jgi:hypothetical protein
MGRRASGSRRVKTTAEPRVESGAFKERDEVVVRVERAELTRPVAGVLELRVRMQEAERLDDPT